MSVGVRVVRGPDWSHGDKDGGEGHVGSVTAVNTDKTCQVVWDNGREIKCSIGNGGKNDLRIVDNAPAGVKHVGVMCDECQQKNILGTRWKCSECHDFDLCTICYFADKHSLTHQFQRIDAHQSTPVKVPKRSISQRLRALGIFPGAVVVRGKDWSYGTQDGGPGSEGKVTDIRNYGGQGGSRNAVKVRWRNGEVNVYKLGAEGKVDLKFIEPGVGTDYYRDHLIVFDTLANVTPVSSFEGNESSMDDLEIHVEHVKMPYVEKPAPRVQMASKPDDEPSPVDVDLHVGDRVCVFLPAGDLKQVQRGRGGWSMRMTECIGQIGKVKNIESDETIEVEYDGCSWQFYRGAVRKVYNIKPGDTVRILSDAQTVELLQKGHGGWEDAMTKACGKVGKVEKIDSDGDVVVQFGQQVWVYSPACMIPASGQNVDTLEKRQEPSLASSRRSENAQDELADGLARLVANLIVMGHQQRMQTIIGPQEMVQACAKGDLSTVQQLIKMKKDLVNCKFKDLTPLMLASHGGHLEVIKLLLSNGADINAKGSENNTALLVAAAGKKEAVALYLVSQGASVKDIDKNNRSLAHHASYAGMFSFLKAVLEKGCNPNLQDVEGDTALHDAVAKGHDRAVNILLSHPNINLTIGNNKGFNPLMLAALKENEFATERLLDKSQSLNKMVTKDGKAALHIAAFNDHRQVASILILKGKANVNLKDNQGLTALHLACHEAYFEMVKLLLQNGADVNSQDNDADTPLHITLGVRQRQQLTGLLGLMLGAQGNDDNDRYKVACLLIENKANVQAKNKNGRNPLEVCQSQAVRNAVQKFIGQRQQPQTRTRGTTGNPLLDLLTGLIVRCANCKQDVANAKFMPCGHKIVCEECSVRFDRCPKCNLPIQARFDNQGRRIVLQDPCQVQ